MKKSLLALTICTILFGFNAMHAQSPLSPFTTPPAGGANPIFSGTLGSSTVTASNVSKPSPVGCYGYGLNYGNNINGFGIYSGACPGTHPAANMWTYSSGNGTSTVVFTMGNVGCSGMTPIPQPTLTISITSPTSGVGSRWYVDNGLKYMWVPMTTSNVTFTVEEKSSTGVYVNTYTYAGCTGTWQTCSNLTFGWFNLPALSATQSGGTANVCYNTSPGTFTANAAGGDGGYSYQWYSNGSPVGTNSSTYNPGNMTSDASFYCTVSSTGCGSFSTTPFNVHVYPNFTATISGGLTQVCYNTNPGTLTATGSGGTGTYTYLWYKNGVTTGVTTSTYNPGNLTNNSSFYCAVSSGGCGTVNTSTLSVTLIVPNVAATITPVSQPANVTITPVTCTSTCECIAQAGGRIFNITASAPGWPACMNWGFPTNIPLSIAGYAGWNPDPTCNTGLGTFAYDAASLQTDLLNGKACFAGTTTYKYTSTLGSLYTASGVPMRLRILVTTPGGAPMPLSFVSGISGNYILVHANQDFKVQVWIEVYTIGYFPNLITGGGSGGSCTICTSGLNYNTNTGGPNGFNDGWWPGNDVYNCIHSDLSSKSCTSFNPPGWYTLSGTVSASSNSPLCTGGTINLFGSSSIISPPAECFYIWSGPNSFSSTSQNPTIPNAIVANSGTYQLLLSDSRVCYGMATTLVSVNTDPAAPTATKSPNTALACPGETLSLTGMTFGSGGAGTCNFEYRYSTDNGSNWSTWSTTLPSFAAAGTSGTTNLIEIQTNCNGSGCDISSSSQYSWTIDNQNPSLTCPSNITVAANSPGCTANVTYNATTTDNCSSAISYVPASGSYFPLGTSTVVATAVDLAGNSASCSFTVTVTNPAVATAGSDSPVCSGSTLNLNSSGGVSYVWAGPNSFTSAIQNPSISGVTTAAAGTYTVTVTDGNGCSDTSSTVVVINNLPSATIGGTISVCQNAAAPNITFTGSNGSYQTVVFYDYSCDRTTLAFSNVSQTFTAPYTGYITTVGAGIGNWCSTNSYGTILSSPTHTINYGTLTYVHNCYYSLCATGNNMEYTTLPGGGFYVYAGEAVTISFSGSGGQMHYQGGILRMYITGNQYTLPYTFTYDINGGTPQTVTTTSGNSVNVAAPTGTAGSFTYNLLSVTDGFGCSQAVSGSATVTVNALPPVTASSNSPVFIGSTLNLFSSGADTYSWTGPNTFNATVQNPSIPNVQLNATGTYTVTGTDANSCTNSASTAVAIYTPAAALDFDGSDDRVALPPLSPIGSGTAGQYSFEAWIYLKAYQGGNGAFIYGDERNYNSGINISVSNGFVITYHPGVGFVNSPVQLPLFTWTHIALVQDANNLKLYQNGVFIQNMLMAPYLQIETNEPEYLGTYTADLINFYRHLNGQLDEVRVWNRALCQDEILNNMNCEIPGSNAGLLANYHFNQGFNAGPNGGLTNLIDASGNTNDGTLINFALNGSTSNWIAPGGVISGTSCNPFVDNVPPTITCPANISTGAALNSCAATVTFSATASDLCSNPVGLSYIPASGSSFNVGTTTVIAVATDAAGNTATCSFTVTVNDTQLPTITCPANITVSNDAGVCGAVVTYNVTSSDNCPGQTVTQTAGLANGSTFLVGNTTNTFKVTDASGNTAICSFIVTVNDTQLPTITCPANITVSNDAGVCGAAVSYAVTSADNCPGQTIAQTAGLASGSTFPVGNTTNTFKVTDGSGNTATCSFIVRVNDTQLPTITCPSNITVSNDNNICGAAVPYAVTSADNCPGQTVAQTAGLANGATFPIGNTTNTFRVTDASGNTSTCSFIVRVNDTQLPTITCPSNITVSNDNNICGAAVPYAVTSADNCPGQTVAQTAGLASGATFPIGNTTNTFRVTDASGNTSTCSFIVRVIDTQLPTITCPANITVSNTTNICGAAVSYAVTSSDNCPGQTVAQTAGLASGATFPVGNTTNTFKVTDASGNTSTCSFIVKVNDTQPPVALCQNITVQLNSGGTATIAASQINNGSSDNCGISTVTVNPSSFTCADVHPTPPSALFISEYLEGSSNNKALEIYNGTSSSVDLSTGYKIKMYFNGAITVGTTINLTGIIAPGGTWVVAYTGSNASILALANQTSSSSFYNGNDAITLENPSGTVLDIFGRIGENPGTAWTSGSFTTVDKTLRRLPTVYQGVTVNPASGFPTLGTEWAQYNVDTYIGLGSHAVNPLPGVTVTLTVNDVNGNSSTCTSYVTVQDITPPAAFCQNLTVQLNSSGTASITAAQINNGSGDACGIASMNVSPGSFTCANVGPNTVTLTVTDVNGNSSTCTSTVTVQDIMPPVALCQNITVQLNSGGTATITGAQVNNGSTDNCGISTLGVSPSSFNCSNVTPAQPTPPALFISEYIEGSSNNKAIEIFNPTPSAISLGSGYKLEMYMNGATTAGVTINLAGPIASGGVYVVAQSSANAAILAVANQTNGSGWFNGNDAVVLRDPSNNILDVFGRIGENPGTAWTDVPTGNTTLDRTLVRKPGVLQGITTNPAAGFPTLGSEWNQFAIDYTANLGMHTASLNLGNTVTLTVTDVNGNSSTCTAYVTVQDITPPVAVCQNITIQLNSSGTAGITAAQINNGSSDVCGIATMNVNPNAFTCANIGSNTVTLTVTDVNGNSSACTATVTVEDVTPPVALCQNITVQLDNTGNASITAAQVNNGSNDACGIFSMSVSPSTFNCSNVTTGAVTVPDLIISEYVEGSSNNKYIELYNGTSSTINLADYQLVLYSNGSATPTTTSTLSGTLATGQTIVYKNSLATIYTGTAYTLGAVNYNGDDAVALYKISTASNIDIFGRIGEDPGTAWTDGGNSTLDKTLRRKANIYQGVTTNPVSGFPTLATEWDQYPQDNVANLGSHTMTMNTGTLVTLTVTDNNNNSSTCTATVTVQDVSPPVALCQNITLQLNSAGTASIMASQINNASTDACGIASYSVSPGSFSCANVGPNTVTLTVTDIHGNSSTCTSTVTVQDITPPVALCHNLIVQLDALGNASITAAQADAGSTDACGIASMTVDPATFNCSDVSTSNAMGLFISEYIEGSSNNKAIELFNGTAATVNLANYKLQFYFNGNITPGTTITLAGSIAAGGTYVVASSGANQTILAAADQVTGLSFYNGNDAVVLEDPIGFPLDIIGRIGEDPGTAWTDVPTGNTTLDKTLRRKATITHGITINPASGFPTLGTEWDMYPMNNADNLGAHVCSYNNSVTLTVLDISGNYSVCSFFVTVQDVTPPAAVCQNLTIQLDNTGNAGITAAQVNNGSSDACGIASMSVSPNTFGCANVGPNTVTLTVTDVNGNSSACSAVVTVQDVTPPVALCQNISIPLDNTGNASIIPSQINNGSGDACGIASYSVSPNSFTCHNLGNNTVVLTVTDNNNNTSTCTSTVTVLDNIAPTLSCIGPQISPTDTLVCTYTVQGTEFNPASTWDNCSYTITNNYNNSNTLAGAIFQKGPHTITWTVTDTSGNSAACTFALLVLDQEVPQLSCAGNQVVNTDNDVCSYTVTGSGFNPAWLWDNCPGVGILNNYNTSPTLLGAVFPKGTTTVTWTATDQSMNVSTCSFTVTVMDVQLPEIQCPQPTPRTTDPLVCTYTAVGNEFNPVSWWDNCPGYHILNDHNNSPTLAGAVFPKGTTPVTWTVADSSGNTASCSFEVTVLDDEYPTLTCPAGQVRPTDASLCSYNTQGAEFDLLSYWDNCTGTTVQNNYNAFSTLAGAVFLKGTTTVVWTATDASGNATTCSFTVTINDLELPQISCVGNQAVNTDTLLCTYTIVGEQFDPVSYWDNCPGAHNTWVLNGATTNSGTNTLAGIILNKDLTTVTWTITDSSGNTAQCSFTVTVVDDELPVIICPGDKVRNTDAGVCTYTAQSAEFDPIITDNCANIYATNNLNASGTLNGYVFPKGTTPVTWTVHDASGNTTLCNLTVTIEDHELPTITCPQNQVRTTDELMCSYVAAGSEFDPDFGDNCPGSVISNGYNALGTLTGAVFPEGTTTVVWTVVDATMVNLATCSFTVTVNDDEIPQITCPPDITLCYENRDFNVMTMPYFAWDNCGVGTVFTNQPPIFPVGINTVTWTAIDIHGNSNTCTQHVTQSDWMAVSISQSDLPIFCQGEKVILTANVTGTPAVAYLWSTGETTPTIEVSVSGTYSVTVTNILGCQAASTFATTIDLSNLLSSYVILTRTHIQLKQTTVLSGGLGVINDDHGKGKIDVKEKSLVTAAGTFVKSSEVHIDNSSLVSSVYHIPADVPLPGFEAMPYTGTLTKNIAANTTVYLSDTLYKEIKVGKNATAIFTQPAVNIMKHLKLEDGATIRFATCARVRTKENIECGKNITINPDGTSVVFYIGHDGKFKEGAHVTGVFIFGEIKHHGEDTTYHHLHIEDSKKDGRHAEFTGMFFAECVHSGKYTTWQMNPLCNFCNPQISKDLEAANEIVVPTASGEPLIEDYPNPFDARTSITFTLPEDDHAKLDVYDISGKLIQTLFDADVTAGEQYKAEFDGSTQPTGIYIYRLTTNQNVFTGKMILNRE